MDPEIRPARTRHHHYCRCGTEIDCDLICCERCNIADTLLRPPEPVSLQETRCGTPPDRFPYWVAFAFTLGAILGALLA